MDSPFRYLRFRLREAGLLPGSRLARIACYLLALDIFLFALQHLLGLFNASYGSNLGGWVTFLSVVVIVLFLALLYRLLKVKLLWRLRNRLIVAYVFIGVIPVILLLTMAFITIYLLAGQFANFVVTSELDARLRSLEAANAALAHELAVLPERGEIITAQSLEGLRQHDPSWIAREVCAWRDGKPLSLTSRESKAVPFALAPFLQPPFSAIVRDQDHLYLRAATSVNTGSRKLIVVSSEPLDPALLEKIAAGLGEISLYATWAAKPAASGPQAAGNAAGTSAKPQSLDIRIGQSNKPGVQISKGNENLEFTFVVGSLPPSTGFFDRAIASATVVPVVDWRDGQQDPTGVAVTVQTRPSMLYTRLFAVVDFAKTVEIALLFVAIVFAVIVFLALLVGTRLTRTVTRAIAQLYDATRHINRGDFSHRIPVTSRDQLATLANSFNSMAASLEQLMEEQKQKQRLENELAIAQEVQAQLFPRVISQLPSLEVHGFCRPARTVSGDYYDFLTVDSNKLILAVGDVSGKGISAALLMATIHSAVRAYTLEGIPILRQPMLVSRGTGTDGLAPGLMPGAEVSTANMLSLLNHQLFASTPMEKYATLFLGYFDGRERLLTYTNGGHLPPILLATDGSIRRLDCGGTVVGLFEEVNYEESTVELHHGEIILAYSDGVTEPENDFGEFGEQRLIDLVWENRNLPLAKISEVVTAAVDDWIGANEQPDDVTLVLARAR